jgi:hypothetical protein
MRVYSATENRIRLRGEGGVAVIRRDFGGGPKHWLLTAYDPQARGQRAEGTTVRPGGLQTDVSSVSLSDQDVGSPGASRQEGGPDFSNPETGAIRLGLLTGGPLRQPPRITLSPPGFFRGDTATEFATERRQTARDQQRRAGITDLRMQAKPGPSGTLQEANRRVFAHFKTGALNRSATHPPRRARGGAAARWRPGRARRCMQALPAAPPSSRHKAFAEPAQLRNLRAEETFAHRARRRRPRAFGVRLTIGERHG